MNQNNGESCPGEGDCREKTGNPLNKYGDSDVEAVCKGCKLFATKPEAIPAEIEPFFFAAFDLAEVEKIGGRFAYPDGLMPHEWLILKVLRRASDRAEKNKPKKK